MLSSGNAVVGRMYETTNSLVEFFKLSDANDNLAVENTLLKNRVVELENKLNALTDTINNVSWKSIRISPESEYVFITAKVIKF